MFNVCARCWHQPDPDPNFQLDLRAGGLLAHREGAQVQ